MCATVAALTAVQLAHPVHFDNLGVSAALETMIAISAVAAAAVIGWRFRQTRLLRDLALLVGVISVTLMDLSMIVPAVAGRHILHAGTQVVGPLVVALAFLAAALAPAGQTLGRPRWSAILGGFLAIFVVDVLTLAPIHSDFGGPSASALQVASAGALCLAASAFLSRRDYGVHERGLLSVACLFLASARLQALILPASVPAGWVSPGTAARAAAYALFLVAALLQVNRARREATRASIDAERQRIAHDLHDGLAQDLAFIAAHGQRLAAELGHEHPLVIAAQRALAASRGTMADLAASSAPTTGAALSEVAEELARRHGVEVEVVISQGRPEPDELTRNQIVRIAREAIVNAVKHGRAQHVVVELRPTGKVLLRVLDDGCGIGQGEHRGDGYGFGLPAMRTRAETVGGRLVASRRPGGGTEIDIYAA